MFFVKSFAHSDPEKAKEMGVTLTMFDRISFMLAGAITAVRLGLYKLAGKIPGLADVADKRVVAIIRKQLEGFGKAHFTTDASAYRPVPPTAKA